MRRCRDHFFGFFCLFSDIEATEACLLFRRRRQQNSRARSSSETTTTGTAIAACSPALHDILSQDPSVLEGFSLLEPLLTPVAVVSGAADAVFCCCVPPVAVADVISVEGVDADSVCVTEAVLALLFVGCRVPAVLRVKSDSKEAALFVTLAKSPGPTVFVVTSTLPSSWVIVMVKILSDGALGPDIPPNVVGCVILAVVWN